jgi:hypothetical protein
VATARPSHILVHDDDDDAIAFIPLGTRARVIMQAPVLRALIP